MSVSLSNAFVTLFDAEVKQAYQGKAMLVGAVRQRRGVEGSTVKFPKVGRGVATARVTQTDVTPMNVGFSTVTCTMGDWNAAEYSDIFSQQKVNFDERSELAQVVGAAIGRRQDQLILDALNAASGTGTVANSIGGSNTNMNIAKLREAAKILNTKNVPAEGRNIIIHANSLASMLEQTSVTSSDFNTVKALVQGEINQYMGFTFHVLGDETAVTKLKDARAKRTEYGQLFEPSQRLGGDTAGRSIEQIIKNDDVTSPEIVNKIFGNADVGGISITDAHLLFQGYPSQKRVAL